MPNEQVIIVPYADGPYLVRGPVVLRDQDGAGIDPGRRTVALCRCGKSRMRPFCDGTHRLVRFRAPSQPDGAVAPMEPKPTRTPKRASTAPGRAARELARDELRAAHRQLGRVLDAIEAEAAREAELAAVTAQLGAIVALVGSWPRRDGC